jgi:acyl-CoA synthetase (AMP-forming)/AMP-acid ligase II
VAQHDLLRRIASFGERECFVSTAASVTYLELADLIADWMGELEGAGCRAGDVVAVRGDFSAGACALMLALQLKRMIAAPLSPRLPPAQLEEMLTTAQADAIVEFAPDGVWSLRRLAAPAERHALIEELRRDGISGLILFSSGSTGRSKASLLDFDGLTDKFRDAVPRPYRTLTFLLLDHIGGINTLLHAVSHGSMIVTPPDRTPASICEAIERWKVELLPTSPTFLNMLLMSDAYRERDLSSLKLITYGTEPMPETTLRALHEALPGVRLKQTYGLSELGILPTQSRSSDSLWIRIGAGGVEHKVIDGVLWVRSPRSMRGYLNAPDPFDADGWFNTEDMVELDGEYMIIRGRKSEIINVGGMKVYPTEVENVLLAAGNVRDVTVFGRRSPVVGQVVVARLSLLGPENVETAKTRLRSFCRSRLEDYKLPVMFELTDHAQYGERFKKSRLRAACEEAQ